MLGGRRALRRSRTAAAAGGLLGMALALVALVVVVVVVVGVGCDRAVSPCARHLLLVTVDTLRADHLGVYGYDLPTSPHLDRFAERAVVFEHAYATSTWTLPSVASTLTSLHPATHRAERTGSVLHGSFETLAERLADEGFRTAAVVSHAFLGRRRGFAQGFGDFESLAEGSPERAERATSAPAVTDRGLAWLDARASSGARWFLWLHYFDPHHAYLERPGLTERFGSVDREGLRVPESGDPEAVARWLEAHRATGLTLYDGEIAFTDRHLGRLFAGLAERGLANDTVVVVGSDHGEEFLEHGDIRHRWNLHDTTLRVPLILRAPGVAPRRVETRVSVLDVAPTVLDLLCTAPLADAAGRSLVPALRGRAFGPAPVSASLRSLDGDVHETIVEGDWKLVRTVKGGEVRLYDLAADPDERNDLSAAHPERVRELGVRLDEGLERARRRGEAFGEAPEIRFGPAERARLRALGYLGD